LEPLYDGRLKWISEKDRGLYDAMNKGVKMASGDIIGILNSDDFYTSNNILSQVVENIGELDAVYGDIHYVNDGDLTKMVRYYSSSFFKPWMMRLGFMPAHPSFYCRKSIYQKYGLFDTSFKVAADFEQLLRLIFINRISIKYLPIDFVTMRTGGASSSGMTSHKSIIKDHMLAYKKNGVYSNYLLEGMRYLYKILEITKYKLLRI
jgi:glycosyltransferase involved in cell wall biosynthesis